MRAKTCGSEKTPDKLISVLMDCQKAKKRKYLTKEDLKAVAKEMRLPESRVYSVATFYSLIGTEPRGRHIVQVCKDVPCYVNGAFNVLDELEKALEIKIGETTKDGLFTLEHTSCLGYCEIAPVMRIDEQIYGNLTSEKLAGIIAGYRRKQEMENIEVKLLTKRFGEIDPLSIDDYTDNKGYEALKKAASMSAESIVDEIKKSGLKGRGGAGFPVGLKMQAVMEAESEEKYIICNADEGEPGNFKDRYLMENDPHQLIEGMAISGLAVGAQKGFIFIRGEYNRAEYIMRTAVAAAREKGFIGCDILGSGKDFDIEFYIGAGSYVCGEEFALMLCIEGNPGRSTYKPPFPTTMGLYNQPTQINNVESLSNIPHIILGGADAFAKIGTKSSTGTKLVSLSGNVRKSGLYEVPFGVTVREIIENLGNGVSGGDIKMVQLGGASGSCIPKSMLGLKLDYEEFKQAELTFGSGAVIVMDENADVLDIVRNNLEFFYHESCGKCTPCREGITHLLILLDRFITGVAEKKDLELIEALADSISLTSICGLGQAAPTSLKSTLRFFHTEYTSKIKKYHAKVV